MFWVKQLAFSTIFFDSEHTCHYKSYLIIKNRVAHHARFNATGGAAFDCRGDATLSEFLGSCLLSKIFKLPEIDAQNKANAFQNVF